MKLKIIIGLIVLLAGIFVLGKTVFRANIGEMAYKRAASDRLSKNILTDLDDGLHVVLCGTGSPMPDPSRMGPCTAVIAGDRMFVIDMGAGAGRNFAPMGLPAAQTEAVLLTHFHSDHISGLGDFLIQRWANSGATSPLPIYGPEGVVPLLQAINTVYAYDQSYRIKHHGDLMPKGGYGGAPVPFEIGTDGSVIILEEEGLKITAFTVEHGGIVAVGYRFDYKGRSVVISGDTSQSENLESHAQGADILVHEALSEDMIDIMSKGFNSNGQQRLGQIFQEIKGIHTSPVQAAESANRANVKMLVLSHIIPPAPSTMLDAFYMKGTKDKFGGQIVMGQDGMLFSLPAEGDGIETKNLF